MKSTCGRFTHTGRWTRVQNKKSTQRKGFDISSVKLAEVHCIEVGLLSSVKTVAELVTENGRTTGRP